MFLYDKGLTNFEANLLFSVFNISVILFEPLSAIISELLPKKGSFIIGCILKVITSLIFINAQSLKVLIIAEIISGLSIGFISGSLVAWAVDKLKSKNQWENGYEIFALVSKYKTIFLIIGGLLGAYLGEKNLTIPWIANCISFSILIILSFILMDTRPYETKILKNCISKIDNNIYNLVLKGYKLAINDKYILLLILSTLISSMSLASLQMFRLPMIKNGFAINQISLGYIWIFIECGRLLGSFFVKKFYSSFKIPMMGLIFMPFISSGFLISAFYFSGNSLMLLCFFAFEFLEPFYSCLKDGIINSRIQNEGRITVLSLESIADKLGSTIGLVFIGYLADKVSMTFAWYFSSVIFIFTSLLYLGLFKISLNEMKYH